MGIEHFDKTVESLDDNIDYESDDNKTSEVQAEQDENVIYDVIEDTKKDDEENGLDISPVKIVIDEAPDTREASMIVHDPIDRDSLGEESIEDKEVEIEVQVEEASEVQPTDQTLETDAKPEEVQIQDVNPKVAEQDVFKSKLSQTLQNLPKSYFTEPDIVIEEKN